MELKELEGFHLYNLAKQIVQYQNFKTDVALEKMSIVGFSESTARAYFNNGIRYLNDKNVVLHGNLKRMLDKCLSECIQPYVPRECDKRPEYKPRIPKAHQKETVLPIQNLEILNKPVTAKYECGLRLGNRIIILEENEAEIFIRVQKDLGLDTNVKIVKVEVD